MELPPHLTTIRKKGVDVMSRNEVRDKSGRLLYYTQKSGNRLEVRDASGRLLGYCQNGETRDASGKLVAKGESPGLLYKG